MKKIKKQTLDGNIETFLLSILEEGPNYGYAIVNDINDKASGLLKLGEGTVYPVLHRLEEKKLISSYWCKAQNGRKRKYYKLNRKGKNALSENISQWQYLTELMANFTQKTQIVQSTD